MGLPSNLQLVEVAPRDGLQAEARTLPTETKLAFIDRLAAAGHTVIEATSFVNPRAVPQMADAAEVMARAQRRPGVSYEALVPNVRGAQDALIVFRDAFATEKIAARRAAGHGLAQRRDDP